MNTKANCNSGSGIMNDTCQQRNERLTGVTENLRRFYNTEPSEEGERYAISFRSMKENRNKESNKDFQACTLQNVDVDAEDRKVQPYQYMRRSSNHYEENRETTVNRPCTDDVLVAPPTVLSMPSSVLQSHDMEQKVEPSFHRNLIEVGNDLIPMSGVAETSHAYKLGRTIDTSCAECNTVMFSLESASMVVCPLCRCVSPIERYSRKKLLPTTAVHAGIGLPIDFVIALE
jgi:hypothetical protein